MLHFAEEEYIYNIKTKDYFKEIASNYSNRNYRSAIVILYSTVIYDLYLKLEELVEIYNDESASKILDKINNQRKDITNLSKWEMDLINILYKETEIIGKSDYADLMYLKDIRNLSAHPALNDEFELYVPSKDITVALIRQCLVQIFIKPPIFIKNIVDFMTEDLKDKWDIYSDNLDQLEIYLKRKYFLKMSNNMKKRVLKSYWKFCFNLTNDEDCQKNLAINTRVLHFIIKYDFDLLYEYMKTEHIFQTFDNESKNAMMALSVLLAKFPKIYSIFEESNKLKINHFINNNHEAKAISWYTKCDKTTHIHDLITEDPTTHFPIQLNKFMAKEYKEEGLMEQFLNLMITIFSNSYSFDMADNNYDICIKPYLDDFNTYQFLSIFEAINSNSQIYNRGASISTNTDILSASKHKMEPSFKITTYSNIRYYDYENPVQDTSDESSSEYDDFDIPF